MRRKLIIGILLFLIIAVALTTALLFSKEPVSAPDDGAAEDFSVTIMPIVTAVPEEQITPAPDPVLSFAADMEYPLPTLETALEYGSSSRLRGTICSNVPLAAVRISISCHHNDDKFYPYVLLVNFDESEQVFSYSLDSDATLEGYSLDAMTRFSDLQIGLHTLKISAMVRGGKRFTEVARTQFNVLSSEWQRIKASDFNGAYETALSFFKDKNRFLYRYQWVYGRYIIADPEWENEYITSVQAFPDGQEWKIHIDALPYYANALSYIRSSYVRVHGSNGDSGVLPLSALIYTYDGSYVSRFTSSQKTISHHAFGTATDLNARLAPNLNQEENNELIHTEVHDYLSYIGILTENGQSYYDYSYTGSYATTRNRIPESVVNYLLYELAFYRAGFQWGHYYISTSDAMHFTLTDNILGDHDGSDGLRKVFEYYN